MDSLSDAKLLYPFSYHSVGAKTPSE